MHALKTLLFHQFTISVGGSSLELFSFNHEFNKRLLLFFLGCKMKTSSSNENDRKDKNTGNFVYVFALPFGIWYLFCCVTVSLVRLWDIRQWFWRNINYNLNYGKVRFFKIEKYYMFSSLNPGKGPKLKLSQNI